MGVVCRIRSFTPDRLENWASGKVTETWPKLPGVKEWDLGEGLTGVFPDVVPYKVEMSSGWIYVHRDDHTLIRREGLQPHTRVKGISKRLEVRTNKDGSKEKFDHVTERGKRILEEVSDS